MGRIKNIPVRSYIRRRFNRFETVCAHYRSHPK